MRIDMMYIVEKRLELFELRVEETIMIFENLHARLELVLVLAQHSRLLEHHLTLGLGKRRPQMSRGCR